jgi:predicted RNase H-like HicB family nuclease
MARRAFTASIWREGRWYVAQCLEVDVASQGRTQASAVKNLQEAVALHLAPPVATIDVKAA